MPKVRKPRKRRGGAVKRYELPWLERQAAKDKWVEQHYGPEGYDLYTGKKSVMKGRAGEEMRDKIHHIANYEYYKHLIEMGEHLDGAEMKAMADAKKDWDYSKRSNDYFSNLGDTFKSSVWTGIADAVKYLPGVGDTLSEVMNKLSDVLPAQNLVSEELGNNPIDLPEAEPYPIPYPEDNEDDVKDVLPHRPVPYFPAPPSDSLHPYFPPAPGGQERLDLINKLKDAVPSSEGDFYEGGKILTQLPPVGRHMNNRSRNGQVTDVVPISLHPHLANAIAMSKHTPLDEDQPNSIDHASEAKTRLLRHALPGPKHNTNIRRKKGGMTFTTMKNLLISPIEN